MSMSDLARPRRSPKQARSGDRLFVLEELAVKLLIEGGPSAVTPKALIQIYREAGGKVSKQWVSNYMGPGNAIIRRLATGHFRVLAKYAEEAGHLAVMSPDLEQATKILALHVTGAQDPWFARAHPALCGLVIMEGLSIQGQWSEAVAAAVAKVLTHFQPDGDAIALAGPATYALLGAWFGLVLQGRERDDHRLAYLSGAFLGVVRAG